MLLSCSPSDIGDITGRSKYFVLTALASPKSDGLSVLLQLGNQCISVFHNVRVLLVLVVGAVGLNDAVDSVNRACNAVARDILGEIAKSRVS